MKGYTRFRCCWMLPDGAYSTHYERRRMGRGSEARAHPLAPEAVQQYPQEAARRGVARIHSEYMLEGLDCVLPQGQLLECLAHVGPCLHALRLQRHALPESRHLRAAARAGASTQCSQGMERQTCA